MRFTMKEKEYIWLIADTYLYDGEESLLTEAEFNRLMAKLKLM